MTLTTLNGVIALILHFFSPNSISIALLANYVTVVKGRPIMSVKYCLPVSVFHCWPSNFNNSVKSTYNQQRERVTSLYYSRSGWTCKFRIIKNQKHRSVVLCWYTKAPSTPATCRSNMSNVASTCCLLPFDMLLRHVAGVDGLNRLLLRCHNARAWQTDRTDGQNFTPSSLYHCM